MEASGAQPGRCHRARAAVSAYDWESQRETLTLGDAIQRFRDVNGYVGLPIPAKPAFLKVFRRLINGRRPPEQIYRVHDASHVLTGTTFTHDEPPLVLLAGEAVEQGFYFASRGDAAAVGWVLFYGGAFVECARRIAPFGQVFRGIRLGLFNAAYAYAVRTRLTDLFISPWTSSGIFRWPRPGGGWACRRADRRPSSTVRFGFRRPWPRRSDASGRVSTSGVEPTSVASGPLAAGVEAGRARAVGDEEQEDQHIQQGELPAVLERHPAAGQVNLEERDEHLDGQDQRHRACEQAEHQQQPAEGFQHSRQSHLRHERHRGPGAVHAAEHAEQLLQPVLHVEQPALTRSKASVQGAIEARVADIPVSVAFGVGPDIARFFEQWSAAWVRFEPARRRPVTRTARRWSGANGCRAS